MPKLSGRVEDAVSGQSGAKSGEEVVRAVNRATI
jgi:hypothetical protein